MFSLREYNSQRDFRSIFKCFYKEQRPTYIGKENRPRRGKDKKIELPLLIRELASLNMINT